LSLYKAMHVHAIEFYGFFASTMLELEGLGTKRGFFKAYAQLHEVGVITRKEIDELMPIVGYKDPSEALESESISFEMVAQL